ncbi:hypothetical protein M8R19_20295 [Pseudomonas sp. R3.Fl]|uniref:hypothetical protein n=1 Tax=Pseudomonas sp. R3.Fl TaxID=2928708 RepID=UPI00201E29FE|nr:hypothetical protein [Pseudomonas sp. R3.Fl]MCL6691049.1 hypothetical protein [Pseudomonas sp. R3.Fl]
MIDLELLISWLGTDGAKAGIEHSDLTVSEIAELLPNRKPSNISKIKRGELINWVVDRKRAELTKSPEELMEMDESQLINYFNSIKASSKEILDLLISMDIRPGSSSKKNITEFAAREISDIGMYRRVAKGNSAIKPASES